MNKSSLMNKQVNETQSFIYNMEEVRSKYRYWRVRIFYSMFVGYVFFYFTRKSFTFAIPAMIDSLGYSKSDLGIISTVLYVTYGISKFTSGVISDRSNPRYFMSVGLILTGICNLFFGSTTSLLWFAIFWGLNGWFQGWGWPPITKQLTHWYSKKERGLWWSVCGISHNVGGALIPFIAGYYAKVFGWQYAMYIPGIMCTIMGFFLFNRLRDVPASMGLPPVEIYKGETTVQEHQQQQQKENEQEKNLLSVKDILFTHVLCNRFIWLLGLSYFFVYVIRTAINDWTVLYLVQERGYSALGSGSSIAWFEGGGLLGMLVAGWITDALFRGNRVPFMVLCGFGLTLSIIGFRYATWGYAYDCFFISMIGFWVFGPQMLVGLTAAEAVDKKAAGTANGFVGCWAYVGAAVTGYPLGAVIDVSWDAYFNVLVLSSFAVFIIMFLVIWAQKQQEKQDLNEINTGTT